MLPYNARTNNQGFTMVEILAVIIIIGILSAIAAPSFLGMFNRNKVNDALNQVRGALQEAQREAIRKSKSCQVNITAGTNPTLTGSCLITGARYLEGVAIRSSNSAVTFNFRGRVGVGGASTIIIASTDSAVTNQKCLVIASGIGIMRAGDYDDSDTTGADSTKCTTSQ